jgi:hypothetical protein
MLVDGDENIPFFMGEVFVYRGMEKTQVWYISILVWTFLLHLHHCLVMNLYKTADIMVRIFLRSVVS